MDHGIVCSPQSLTFLVNVQTYPSNGSSKILDTATQINLSNTLPYRVAYSLRFSPPRGGQSSSGSPPPYGQYKIDPRGDAAGFLPSHGNCSIRVVRTGGGDPPEKHIRAEADMELTWCIATEGGDGRQAVKQAASSFHLNTAQKRGILKELKLSIHATLSKQSKASITPPSAKTPYVDPTHWKSGQRTSFTLSHPIDRTPHPAHFSTTTPTANARGGYAEVWKCRITADDVELPFSLVAVKSFLYEIIPSAGETAPNNRAWKELAIWRRLDHPHIAPLLGSFKSSSLCLVTIWYECGTLLDCVSQEKTTASDRIRILREMAEGLEYLHSNNVIHGDIHKGNVLANRDETGSIHPVYIDFGLSKILEDSSGQTVITSSIRQKGYMRYMAPELLRYIHPPRHKASDIYALGLLLLEVASNGTAFSSDQLNMVPQVLQSTIAAGSLKPVRTRFPFLATAFWDFLSLCWKTEATDRPSIWDITERLGAMRGSDCYQKQRTAG